MIYHYIAGGRRNSYLIKYSDNIMIYHYITGGRINSYFIKYSDNTHGQGGSGTIILGHPDGSLCSPSAVRIIVPERPPAHVCKDTALLMCVIIICLKFGHPVGTLVYTTCDCNKKLN